MFQFRGSIVVLLVLAAGPNFCYADGCEMEPMDGIDETIHSLDEMPSGISNWVSWQPNDAFNHANEDATLRIKLSLDCMESDEITDRLIPSIIITQQKGQKFINVSSVTVMSANSNEAATFNIKKSRSAIQSSFILSSEDDAETLSAFSLILNSDRFDITLNGDSQRTASFSAIKGRSKMKKIFNILLDRAAPE